MKSNNNSAKDHLRKLPNELVRHSIGEFLSATAIEKLEATSKSQKEDVGTISEKNRKERAENIVSLKQNLGQLARVADSLNSEEFERIRQAKIEAL
jgi:hypothetical protein